MLRDLGGERCWITIISAGRAANVTPMRAHIPDATWYVPAADVGDYKQQGIETVRADSGSLIAARNDALTDAFKQDATCIQLSDDLKGIKRWSPDGSTTEIPVMEALEDVVVRLHASGLRLGGVAPTNNAYFTRRASAGSHFILGDLMVVRPCHLRFDTNLRLKEDYDFTAQHVAEFGGVVRCDDLLPTFGHYTNKGGAVAYRTPVIEEETIAYLLRKWPGWIIRNKKREREVLLRLPRRERTVL